MVHTLRIILAIIALTLLAVGLLGLVFKRIPLLRIRSRRDAGIVVAAAAFLMVGISAAFSSTTAPADSTPPAEASRSQDNPTIPIAPAPTAEATTSADEVPPPAAEPDPEDSPFVNLTCADIGGVFEAHGTDGRGDCVSTDPRPECHVAPDLQDENYVAEMTTTPPFPGGSVDLPYVLQAASNKQCWLFP